MLPHTRPPPGSLSGIRYGERWVCYRTCMSLFGQTKALSKVVVSGPTAEVTPFLKANANTKAGHTLNMNTGLTDTHT